MSMAPVFPVLGGQKTGPNSMDRGKLGSKRHIVEDVRGTCTSCSFNVLSPSRSAGSRSVLLCVMLRLYVLGECDARLSVLPCSPRSIFI
jgi:hypothetical protein